MKRKKFAITFASAFVLMFVLIMFSNDSTDNAASASNTIKWEYKCVQIRDFPLPPVLEQIYIISNRLNEQGLDGWELVALTDSSIGILKRRVP